MNYSDILHNPHFNNLASIVRVPFWSKDWKEQHARVPFWTLIDNLKKVTPLDPAWNKTEVMVALTKLLVSLTEADERLSYTEEDLAWLVETLDSDNHKTIIMLWMAWFSASDTMLTPVEIAEKTGTSESQWRNKAAAGEFPGAVKSGGTWQIPKSILRSLNILQAK